MATVSNPMNGLTLNGMNAALRFYQISLDSAEQLMKLNLDLSKQCLDQQTKTVRDMTGVSDPQELFKCLNQMASQSIGQAMENSRSAYDVIAHAQEDLSQLIAENVGAFNDQLTSAFGTFGQTPPAGADFALNAVKSSIASLLETMNSFANVAKQTTESAVDGFKSAAMSSTPLATSKPAKSIPNS